MSVGGVPTASGSTRKGSTVSAFLTQVWRFGRLGAAAFTAQYVAAGVTHPKQGYVAGAVAAVEVIYRAAVPAKDQSFLTRAWAAIQSVEASQTPPVSGPPRVSP